MEAVSDVEGGMEIPKRKRGPYKLYLAPSTVEGESANSFPRTTRWRRLLTENTQENPNDETEEIYNPLDDPEIDSSYDTSNDPG